MATETDSFSPSDPSNSGEQDEARIRVGARRNRRTVIESDPEEEEEMSATAAPISAQLQAAPAYNMDTDISKLEAPTFTTLDRGPSQPMLSLTWDHKVNLMGKKVVNPMIHCCDRCLKPILIYGRMIPCKHVFCLHCAQASEKASCSRCGDKVARVEQAGLGSIYMCTHGGTRYGNSGCRRTYLSQRDLQAHIQHRHVKAAAAATAAAGGLPVLPSAAAIAEATKAIVNARNQARASSTASDFGPPSSSRPPAGYASSSPYTSGGVAGAGGTQPLPQQSVSHISVIGGGRPSNLITVPIQDGAASTQGGDDFMQGTAASANHPRGGYYSTQQQPQQPQQPQQQQQQQPPYNQFSQPPPNYFGNPSGAGAPASYGPPQGHYERASGPSHFSSQHWRTSTAAAQGPSASYYRR